MSKKILIIGAGGHGRSVADLVLQLPSYKLIGFLDDNFPQLQKIWTLQVFGKVGKNELDALKDCVDCVFVAIGDNAQRKIIFDLVVSMEFHIPFLVHPMAYVSPRAVLGAGTVVMANAVVGTEAHIGCGVIINCGSTVDHDAKVGDFAHLGVNVSMAGGSRLNAGFYAAPGTILKRNMEMV